MYIELYTCTLNFTHVTYFEKFSILKFLVNFRILNVLLTYSETCLEKPLS